MWFECLAVVLALLSAISPISGFNCETSKCSCSAFNPTTYELHCQDAMYVNINLHKSVSIQCFNNDPSVYSNLTNLQIGNVNKLIFRLCPLPDMSIKDLMTSMGIGQIKMLQFQSYGNLGNTLSKKHLENLFEVTNLSLDNNNLTVLPENVFEDLTNLTWLDLKFNQLQLPKYVFSPTSKLEVLDLGMNDMTSLVPGIFKNLTHLRLLNLWSNRLESLNRSVFSDLPNLESLDLNSNRMRKIKPDLFLDLAKLKRLNLYGNDFESLPPGLLSRNGHLQEFQMHENKRSLMSLPSGFLSNLPELKMVRLTGCKLMSLPADMFEDSKNIRTIYLDNNKLTTLEEQIFKDLEAVELIDLSKNEISELPGGLFSGTINLKTLLLFNNEIKNINNSLFLQLRSLDYLDLRFNRLEKIEGDQFSNLISLKTLNISDNYLTSLLSSYSPFGVNSVLQACIDLEDLQLANNSLTEMFEDWRILFNKLKILNLSFNRFKAIDINSLDFLSDVTIDLSNNSITLVDLREYRFLEIKVNEFPSTSERDQNIQTKTVKLNNNPLSCNCRLLDFVLFVQGKLSNEIQYLFRIDNNNYGELICHEPLELENDRLRYLNPSLLTCPSYNVSKKYACPNQCNCFFSPYQMGNIIDCESASFTQIPGSLDLFEIGTNHTELHLEGNYLRSFQIPENQGYENVTHFYLANNNITSVNFTGFSPELKVLDLSENLLTSLSEEAVSFLQMAPNLVELSLHGNKWHCGCEALPLIRLIKERFNQVLHRNSITCAGSGTPLVKLIESDLCPEKATMVIILCSIFTILMIIILVLTVLYYKYKREVQIYCFSSRWRVVRWMVSHPDLDEDKIYDAFVSFANEDEEFVVEHLVPQLEENGELNYKLCLHYRDWVGGEMIQTQVFNSVKTSRRTIVVLSPNFLKSVWGTMEFKTAHAEALKEGTAKVIVVLYKDVGGTEDLDEELKAYLQMNTYVKWGSPWFWQQLKYALPHPPGRTDDIQCGFGCLPKINRGHRAQNMTHNGIQIRNGKLSIVSDSPEKKIEKDSEKNGQSKYIMDSLDSNAKTTNGKENHQNGTAVAFV